MTRIYLVTNCYGDPNKIYIGKTKNSRFKKHQETYGENINYSYIDYIESLSYKDWEPLESFWIEQFRQWGFEILNKRKKGGSGPEFQTEESKRKLSLSLTGVKHKPHRKHKSYKRLNPSIKGINHHLYGKKQTPSHIKKRSNKRPGVGEKISIKQKGIKKHTQITKNKISLKNQKPVIQFHICGDFIKEWGSLTEVENELGLSKRNISNTCNGRQNTSGGFIWRFK